MMTDPTPLSLNEYASVVGQLNSKLKEKMVKRLNVKDFVKYQR